MVNKESALFRLLRCVFTNFYKCGNYVIKGIHIIIEHHEIHKVGRFNRLHNIHEFFLLLQRFHWL